MTKFKEDQIVTSVVGMFFGLFFLASGFLITMFDYDGRGTDLPTAFTAFALSLIGGFLIAFFEKPIHDSITIQINYLSFLVFCSNGILYHFGGPIGNALSLSVRQGTYVASVVSLILVVSGLVFVFQTIQKKWQLWSNALGLIGLTFSSIFFLLTILMSLDPNYGK